MSEARSPAMQAASPKSRRYPEDFKRDAVRLVTHEQYTVKAAAQAVGVSEKSLYDWHEKINLAGVLYVLTEQESRDQYLDFVARWLHPPGDDMNLLETGGYWERRWMAVNALEHMEGASEAIPLLEEMLNEEKAESWVSIHVPRVLGVLME